MRTPATSESRPHSKRSAVASIMLGALAIGCSSADAGPAVPALVVLMLASSLLAVLLGVWARRQVRRGNGLVRRSGLAAWSIGLAIVTVCVSVLPRSSNCAGARPAQALNNLKQIGLALNGPERTLLVVEASVPVPWTSPIDLPYRPATQLPPLGGVFKGRSGVFGYGAVDGCNVVFADAMARFVPRAALTQPALSALITRNGN